MIQQWHKCHQVSATLTARRSLRPDFIAEHGRCSILTADVGVVTRPKVPWSSISVLDLHDHGEPATLYQMLHDHPFESLLLYMPKICFPSSCTFCLSLRSQFSLIHCISSRSFDLTLLCHCATRPLGLCLSLPPPHRQASLHLHLQQSYRTIDNLVLPIRFTSLGWYCHWALFLGYLHSALALSLMVRSRGLSLAAYSRFTNYSVIQCAMASLSEMSKVPISTSFPTIRSCKSTCPF